MTDASMIAQKAQQLSQQAASLADDAAAMAAAAASQHGSADPFIFGFTVFVLACFVGYYVVWRVTPALHTPLMSVTNAISGIIIVGAIAALGAESGGSFSHIVGFVAVTLASVNIFGGFIVTQRMLGMFQKKEKKP